MSMEIRPRIPNGYRCSMVITFDTDMAGGYAPDGVCHGRTAPFLKEHILQLCSIAEEFNVRLQFFQIANGLEDSEDISYLQEILRRGHAVDCHTYNHVNLAHTPPQVLDDDLARATHLFVSRLGIQPGAIRGPGGYRRGELSQQNQSILLKHGYRWVSGEVDYDLPIRDESYWISSPARGLPYQLETGLVEIPIQGWTDRMWFDHFKCVDAEAYIKWRREWGHKAVGDDWRCPWTADEALDEWVRMNLATLDYAYEHRLSWVICWHPYSHYLHDRKHRMLRALLEAACSKPERVWVCSLRDYISCLESSRWNRERKQLSLGGVGLSWT